MTLDPAIARRAQRGDEKAFELIVQAASGFVHGLAWRMTYDRDRAADVAQEVFLHLYENLSRYDPSRPFEPWFQRLAVNAAVNACRKRRRRETSLDGMGRSAGDGAGADERPYEPADPADGPAEVAAEREARLALRAAVRALPPAYAAVVALYYLEERPVKEIAEALGIPEGTVKIRLYRARDVLRAKLEPGGRA